MPWKVQRWVTPGGTRRAGPDAGTPVLRQVALGALGPQPSPGAARTAFLAAGRRSTARVASSCVGGTGRRSCWGGAFWNLLQLSFLECTEGAGSLPSWGCDITSDEMTPCVSGALGARRVLLPGENSKSSDFPESWAAPRAVAEREISPSSYSGRGSPGARGGAPALGPGCDPGVPGSSPASGSLHGACFSLCLCLCLSVSHEKINKIFKKNNTLFNLLEIV